VYRSATLYFFYFTIFFDIYTERIVTALPSLQWLLTKNEMKKGVEERRPVSLLNAFFWACCCV